MSCRPLTQFISVFLIGIFLFFTCVPAGFAETVYFYHNDHLGSPLAMTDMQGNVVWRRDYKPFGQEIDPGGATTVNTHKYTGKEYDPETGLYYYGARYYDPVIGRFISVDPAGGKPDNPQTWNRYVYTLNNPYRYVDPSGQVPIDTIWDAANVAYDIYKRDWTSLGLDLGAMMIPYVPAGITKGVKGANKLVDAVKAGRGLERAGTEVVERAMSQAELEATRATGLLRGGRTTGEHYVSEAVNRDPLRARQRLALPQTPEVRVRMEVPEDIFSPPSKVEGRFGMPGGGMERSAPGSMQIPVRIKEVQEYTR